MNPSSLPASARAAIGSFLDEDLGNPRRDVTAEPLVPTETRASGLILGREEIVVCGLDVAAAVFQEVDASCAIDGLVDEGERAPAGTVWARLSGAAAGLLAAERTALNLLQRMSSIATATARYVVAADNPNVAIMDTRKTAPGLRWFDKRAVATGGGRCHRVGLFDQVLIKENHLAALGESGGRRPLERAIELAKAANPELLVEIEVVTADEAVRAARAGADIVLLDNFDVAGLTAAVAAVRALAGPAASTPLEASGGIQLATVGAVAATGVDRISIGALTHSVVAPDLTLLIDAREATR